MEDSMPRGDAGASQLLISMWWDLHYCIASPATSLSSPACLCTALEQPVSARMAKALVKGSPGHEIAFLAG